MTDTSARGSGGGGCCCIPPHLVEELRQGRVVAFVGAGFTAPAGFPGWKELLLRIATLPAVGPVRDDVEALLKPARPVAHSLDMAAQILEDALNDPSTPPQHELVAELRRLLVPREYPLPAVMERRLELLRRIPFQSILTTNYNPLLRGVTPFDGPRAARAYRQLLRNERVQTPGDGVYGVARSTAAGLEYVADSRPVVQIHGNLAASQSVVLTREGYRRLLFNCPNYNAFIKSALATKTVLYLGFSFSDAYLNELQSEVASLVGCGHGCAPIAYALVNDYSEAQCRFSLEHNGTHCISFDTVDPAGDGWGGFDRIFEAIAAAVED